METSLIGKALDFGPSEYGFEPRVSNYPQWHKRLINE